jgi:hypothetical protein
MNQAVIATLLVIAMSLLGLMLPGLRACLAFSSPSFGRRGSWIEKGSRSSAEFIEGQGANGMAIEVWPHVVLRRSAARFFGRPDWVGGLSNSILHDAEVEALEPVGLDVSLNDPGSSHDACMSTGTGERQK